RDELSPAQEQAVKRFAAAGGVVIETDRRLDWSTPVGRTAAFAALRAAFRPHVPPAPLRVSGGPGGRYGIAYRSGSRLVVAVTNDFSFVQITKRGGGTGESHRPRRPPAGGPG